MQPGGKAGKFGYRGGVKLQIEVVRSARHPGPVHRQLEHMDVELDVAVTYNQGGVTGKLRCWGGVQLLIKVAN